MNKNAFTLVELIVGITISMIVMVGLGVFVGGGISNMTLQEKILDNGSSYEDFSSELQKVFSRLDKNMNPIITASGVIFKQDREFSDGGFVYIGIDSIAGAYCENIDEIPETNHVFLKNFIPFEEQEEDIFGDYSDVLTSKNINGYHTDQKNHVVIRESDLSVVVGKGVFGDKFIEGAKGTDIYLNNPTGLASSGSLLFISDSLNNRVLAYDISADKVYSLLDETDGLLEPTGLYYDSSSASLYISNSGAGEILKYSSENLSEKQKLEIVYSGSILNNIDKIKLGFFKSGTGELISGFGESDFTLSWVESKSDDFANIDGNESTYYFVNYSGVETSQADCNESGEILGSLGNPINCTSSGSGYTSTPVATSIDSGDSIGLSNITLPNFSTGGVNYLSLEFLDGNTVEYSSYFPYFTQGDSSLLTKDDNTLTVYRSGLNYPTGIWGVGDGEFNEFLDGNYDDLVFDEINDYKLETPVSSFDVSYDSNLLSLDFKYYKQYNCYNPDQRIERSFMMKKSYK